MIKATNHSNEILANVIAMDEEQLNIFLASLSPDTLDYLDILLTKVNSQKLKKYIKSK